MRTRAEMERVIRSGQSIVFDGRIITDPAGLPADEEIVRHAAGHERAHMERMIDLKRPVSFRGVGITSKDDLPTAEEIAREKAVDLDGSESELRRQRDEIDRRLAGLASLRPGPRSPSSEVPPPPPPDPDELDDPPAGGPIDGGTGEAPEERRKRR